ncbi:unnamed protein product [Urochloa humidicola]
MNTFIFLSNGAEDTQPASPSSHPIDSRFGFVQLRDTVKAFRKEKPHPGRKIILLKLVSIFPLEDLDAAQQFFSFWLDSVVKH